jgi:pyruvate kinase
MKTKTNELATTPFTKTSPFTKSRFFENRRVKIVATLGPSSSTKERILELVQAGANVFRLNFSHGTHEDHASRLKTIREIESELAFPIGVLADLQGPKLRCGVFVDGKVDLKKGQHFILDSNPEAGNCERVYLPHPEILKVLKPNQFLLLDDGKIKLKVLQATPDKVITQVIAGGALSNRKGVNVPDAIIPMPALTPKDLNDLEFALEQGVDWVALSFVQLAADVIACKKLVAGRALVMAKIEKPSALTDIIAIIAASDAIMVARGDLGVETPAEDVPATQKMIIRACRQAAKPVIVATQMMESMISSPTPTRAEVSDVATAVFDGADAVMLSAESASGAYPVEAVDMMAKIIRSTERDEFYADTLKNLTKSHEQTPYAAIAAAAVVLSETIGSKAIITYTSSGQTTFRVASDRPKMPIISLTASINTARRMCLVWGTIPIVGDECHSFAEMLNICKRILQKHSLATKGDHLVVTAGVPFGSPGATNIVRLVTMP